MRVFVYCAALLCEACGTAARESLTAEGHGVADADDESSYDSDDFPKGPYGDGGGEADSPQHCDHCGEFLDNALTGAGESYVREALEPYTTADGWTRDSFADHVAGNCERAGKPVLASWARAYGYALQEPDDSDAESSTYASDTRRGELSDDLGESPDY